MIEMLPNGRAEARCQNRAEEDAWGIEINPHYKIKACICLNTMVKTKLPTFSLSFNTWDAMQILSEKIYGYAFLG